MRKVVVSTIISADGYHEGVDHNVSALPFDDGFSAYNLQRLEAADTLLVGRASYEMFRSYWPGVADDPSQPEVERAISRRNNAIEKVVVSDGLGADETAPWTDTTRVVGRAGAPAAVAELKQGDGGDIVIFGSRITWNALLIAGVVDEVHLLIGPALLGAGTSVFGGPSPVRLRLLETRVLEDSQLILARYAPAG